MESLLDGLASGLTYALLAAALALAHIAWLGLDRPRRPDIDPRLHLIAALLGALGVAWLLRRAVGGLLLALPQAPLLGWALPPALLVALVLLWRASRFGRVWRAQAERPVAAHQLGLPLRRAGVVGLGLAAVLGAAAALPASGTVLTAVIAPEVKALAAALAAGPGSPLAAALLALLVGLAEGAAATLAPDGWLSVWPRAVGYAVLLPFLLLRPDWHWFEDAGDG